MMCRCGGVCKADWYSVKVDQENAERVGEENIELAVSNSSCSAAVQGLRGFRTSHQYTLVISARLNMPAARRTQYKLLLNAASSQCRIQCQLKTIVSSIVNQSRPVIDRSAISIIASSYQILRVCHNKTFFILAAVPIFSFRLNFECVQ